MALQYELSSFAQRMGLADIALSRAGVAALDIQHVGRVYFESQGEDCLVYLVRPVVAHDRHMARRILSLCHYARAHPFPLTGGLHKGQALLLTRMPEREVTAAVLETALRYLAEQMDGLSQG